MITIKQKRSKRIIAVSCEDEELRDAIYNIINNKGSIALSSADAVTDEEEDKLWHLSVNINNGIKFAISISILDSNDKELYNLSRCSQERENATALITYDLEKTL